jgi:hypothetical protein
VKRSTWTVVLAACTVLIAAGSLPRLPWDAMTSAWRDGAAGAITTWPVRVRRLLLEPPAVPPVSHVVPPPAAKARAAAPVVSGPRLTRPRLTLPRFTLPHPVFPARVRSGLPALPLSAGAWTLAGALGGLALLALLAMTLRRDARGRVWRMARDGRPTSRIARDARLAQDAVRVLLTPGLGARRR